MTDKKQNEQEDTLRDLDLPEGQAEDLKGGLKIGGAEAAGFIKAGTPIVAVTADAHSGNDN